MHIEWWMKHSCRQQRNILRVRYAWKCSKNPRPCHAYTLFVRSAYIATSLGVLLVWRVPMGSDVRSAGYLYQPPWGSKRPPNPGPLLSRPITWFLVLSRRTVIRELSKTLILVSNIQTRNLKSIVLTTEFSFALFVLWNIGSVLMFKLKRTQRNVSNLLVPSASAWTRLMTWWWKCTSNATR